ncbi:MAG TPA: ABC transporter ATP-binding protein, partial [Actinomycetes bacterium]|nr:ABC transporter ATP-binding protein [Actinomycetes bacterium]
MTAAEDVAAPTIYDLNAPQGKLDLRRLPRLTVQAVRIAWAAGRGEFVASTVLQAISGFGVAALLLLGQQGLDVLLEAVSEGSSLVDVLPWVLAIAFVAALQLFVSAVQRERQEILGELMTRHVQSRLLEVTSAADLVAFDTPTFHNRVQRMQMSGPQPLNLVFGLSGLIGAVVGIVSVLVALIAIEPVVIPLVLLVFLPAWLAASRRGDAFFRFFWHMTPRDRERNYVAGLLTDRDAAKEVRAFGLASHLMRRHDQLYDERLTELRTVARRQLWYSLIANFGIGVVLAATLLLVVWLALRGGVPLSSAGIAIAGVAIVGQRLASAGYAAGALAEAARYVDDYLAFVALLPSIEQASEEAQAAPMGFHQLDVDGVSFTYPTGTQPVLHEVSLTVHAGEVVALVGENGSGKTTLAKLLAGLYEPQTGTIRWDGADVRDIDADGLRRSVAVIFQDFVRFHLRARDNIGLGRVEAADDLAAIRAAAVHADADEFLAALAQGYETVLGPEFVGGTDLSIGQWQRVALGRAFFREAPFVILDEPTAALDPRAEHDLFER